MVGNGWEMVGVYPTYVLRSGAFLAGAFFFLKSRPLFIKSTFLNVFIIRHRAFRYALECPSSSAGGPRSQGWKDGENYY